MTFLKFAIPAAMCAFAAAPVFADAAGAEYKANLYDADYEIQLAEHGYFVGAAAYGAGEADYDAFFSTASTFNPLRDLEDAEYETVLAERGFLVGVAVYGTNDADYAAALTPVDFFQTAAAGHPMIDYEAILRDGGMNAGIAKPVLASQ